MALTRRNEPFEELTASIQHSIALARAQLDRVPGQERGWQRLLALLSTASDEIEHLREHGDSADRTAAR
jgi:hypothetical protein